MTNRPADIFLQLILMISISCKNISAGLFSAREHALTFRESFNAKFKVYCKSFWIVLAGFVGGCTVGGFGWFWVVLAGSMF